MPVRSCGGGRFRIGSGKCVFKSKKSALRAQRAVFAKKKDRKKK